MSELDNIHLTYIGGPTILIEVGTLRLLTDPTLDLPGNYETGAFTHSKLVGPAVSASEIGSIDAVLLSRDHHLTILTVPDESFYRLRKGSSPHQQEPRGSKEMLSAWNPGSHLMFLLQTEKYFLLPVRPRAMVPSLVNADLLRVS